MFIGSGHLRDRVLRAAYIFRLSVLCRVMLVSRSDAYLFAMNDIPKEFDAMKHIKSLALVLSLCAVAACTQVQPGTPGNPGTNPGGSGNVGGLEANVMKGVVTNSQGAPLGGVEVYADNTLLYDSNLLASTDASGSYRIDLSSLNTTWHAGASLQTTFEGQNYEIFLAPDDDSQFATATGAVRNFTWKVSGEKPSGGTYGSVVYVYGDYSVDFSLDDVELTLTPEGPLIDGSTGQTLVAENVGGQIDDVPIGRYTVTGRYLEPSGAVRPLLIAPKGSNDFAASQSLTFTNTSYYGPMLEMTVVPQ